MIKLAVLWGASALLACTEISTTSAAGDPSEADAAPPDVGAIERAPALDDAPPHGATCTGTAAPTLLGTASRSNDNGYPDQIDADVTWTLVGSNGCVDTYAPTGTVTYGFAIPGAVCTQSIDPPSHAIAASDGTLTIDRSTSPPTVAAHGDTRWPITWTCRGSDGSIETQSVTGGGVWVDAAALDGTVQRTDTVSCGSPNGTPPCTYRWTFAPS